MRILGLSLATLAGALLVAACGAQATEPDDAAWLAGLIQRLESEPVRNPPASITEYRYKDELVYYVPPACCDIFSDLYDREGRLMCHPDGGLTGRGDGRCPGFLRERSEARLVWRDSRRR